MQATRAILPSLPREVVRLQQQAAAGGGSSRQLQSLLLSLAGDRVMPSRASVTAAARWDLHHAVVQNGGYRAVAEALGRRPAWPPPLLDPQALGAELRELADALGWAPGVLPSQRQLEAAGRDDLVRVSWLAGPCCCCAHRLCASAALLGCLH